MPSTAIRRKLKNMKLTLFLELSNSNLKPDQENDNVAIFERDCVSVTLHIFQLFN